MFSWTKLRTELRFCPFSYSGQWEQKVMGSLLTSMSDFAVRSFFVKSALESIQGSVRAVSRSHLLLLFSGGFGNSSRAVYGQSHLIFG